MKLSDIKLLNLLAKTSPEKALLLILKDNEEDNGEVYLPNAKSDFLDIGFSEKQFAGYLSVLKKQGCYVPSDEYFGEVTDKKIV